MISGAQSQLGKLDILVNNVGIQFVSPVEDFPEDKWDAIMDICLNSTFHATKAALPGMLERGWGRIINTGSMHALVASPYKSAYNAAKHGVVCPLTSLTSAICTKAYMHAPLDLDACLIRFRCQDGPCFESGVRQEEERMGIR